MRIVLLTLCAITCLPTSVLASDKRTVVLVTGTECPMQQLSALEIRKVYMAITISYQGMPIRGFRLNNDEQLDSVFYQYVVAMTKKSYERRLLSLILKHGTPEPKKLDTPEEVAQALRKQRCSIAYMWKSQADKFNELRSLKLIWQGE